MTAQPTPKGAWRITFLLFLFMLVNFADKIVVGTVGFSTLLICRIILGAGEGPAASVAVHAIYKWFPDEKRTLPTAVLSQGSAFGVILAVPALNWVIVNYDWHYAFGALGFIGLIWVVAWLILGKEGPLAPVTLIETEPRIPYLQLLTSRTFVGCVAATFGAYWALSLGLTWFTPFIVKGLGFSQKEAGWISILPWVFGAVVVLLTGWVSQVMVAKGFSTRSARGVLGALPLIMGGTILAIIPYVETGAMQIALLVAGSGLSGSIYVVCAPMISEFTPVSQRGAVISIYGAIYTLAGILAPAVMGSMIQRASGLLDGYMTGFTMNAAVLIASGLLGLLLLWPNTERARLMSGARRPQFA